MNKTVLCYKHICVIHVHIYHCNAKDECLVWVVVVVVVVELTAVPDGGRYGGAAVVVDGLEVVVETVVVEVLVFVDCSHCEISWASIACWASRAIASMPVTVG